MNKRVENMWKAINSFEWDKEKAGMKRELMK